MPAEIHTNIIYLHLHSVNLSFANFFHLFFLFIVYIHHLFVFSCIFSVYVKFFRILWNFDENVWTFPFLPFIPSPIPILPEKSISGDTSTSMFFSFSCLNPSNFALFCRIAFAIMQKRPFHCILPILMQDLWRIPVYLYRHCMAKGNLQKYHFLCPIGSSMDPWHPNPPPWNEILSGGSNHHSSKKERSEERSFYYIV